MKKKQYIISNPIHNPRSTVNDYDVLTKHLNNDNYIPDYDIHDNSIPSMIDNNNNNNNNNNNSNNNNNQVIIDEDNIELIVIVICGLNDWKQLFLKFPYSLNYGPLSFLNELKELTNDIKLLSNELNYSCKIFLPKLPTNVLVSDPNFLLKIKPLGYFVSIICHIWDLQKHAVAFEDDNKNEHVSYKYNYYY